MNELWESKTPLDVPYVIVSWRDIRDISNWDDDSTEIRCARNLATTGWLLYDGPDPAEEEFHVLVIAKTYDYEEQRWAEFTVFPKTTIKEVKGCVL